MDDEIYEMKPREGSPYMTHMTQAVEEYAKEAKRWKRKYKDLKEANEDLKKDFLTLAEQYKMVSSDRDRLLAALEKYFDCAPLSKDSRGYNASVGYGDERDGGAITFNLFKRRKPVVQAESNKKKRPSILGKCKGIRAEVSTDRGFSILPVFGDDSED